MIQLRHADDDKGHMFSAIVSIQNLGKGTTGRGGRDKRHLYDERREIKGELDESHPRQMAHLEKITTELEEKLSREIERAIDKIGCDRMGSKMALTVMEKISVSI